MDETDELQRPLTVVEAAELMKACREGLTPAGMMLLRRLLFERDRLLEEKVTITEKAMIPRPELASLLDERDAEDAD